VRSPTGAARRPVAIKAPAGADAALLSGLLQDMNARCPAARFFQLPHDTSIEDYVFEADQNTFFAGIEFSSLSATNVNFTIRLQCATRSTSSLSFFLPMMMFVSLRHGMLTRNHQQTQVPATEKVNGLGFDRWCYTPPLTYQVLSCIDLTPMSGTTRSRPSCASALSSCPVLPRSTAPPKSASVLFPT